MSNRPSLAWRLAAAATAMLALMPSLLAGPAMAQGQMARGTSSGLPVPRFVSLKSDPVNVCVGPGRDYALAWTFRKQGLPVEVIAEFDNWRKIRDSEGDEGWIFHSLLSGRRTALIAPWQNTTPLPGHAAPDEATPPSILLEPGVLAEIEECSGEWCHLRGQIGNEIWQAWVQQAQIWGAYPNEAVE